MCGILVDYFNPPILWEKRSPAAISRSEAEIVEITGRALPGWTMILFVGFIQASDFLIERVFALSEREI